MRCITRCMVLNIETGESEKDGFETDALKYVEEVTRALGLD